MLNVQVFLKVLYGDKEAEKEKEKKDKFEVDFLKKYNRKMSILKVIAVILFIVVLCTWALTIASLIKIERTYTKSKYIYEVLNEAYGKIEEVQNGHNYSLIEYYNCNSSNYPTIRTMTYKDRHYKEELKNSDSNFWYTNYGLITGIGDVYFQFNETTNNDTSPTCSFTTYTHRNLLEFYVEKNISDYNTYNITIHEYEGNEYYVIEESNGISIWINKNTMLLYKIAYPSTGSEFTYTWSVGNITDEDLKVEGFTNEEMEEMNKNLEEHFYSSFIPMYLILK